MAFAPYEKFTIISQLKPEELQQRLQEKVGISKTVIFNFNRPAEPYIGYVLPNRFEIYRNISYRNSFLPRITGSVEPDLNGSIITISMQMNIVVNIFMAFWLGGVGLAGIAMIVISIKERQFNSGLLVTSLMFVFGYCLATLGFKYESSRSREFLLELSEGYIQE